MPRAITKRWRLLLSVLAVVLVAAAWKWSLVLEARLNDRLENGQALHFTIAKGAAVKFTPPLADAFTISASDLSNYKDGFESQIWEVKRIRFRTSATQKWKTLPKSFWGSHWEFFRHHFSSLGSAQQRKVFSLFSYSDKRDLLVGQYQLRAYRKEEFHDNRSGIRYFGTGTFDFDFHVNPAPQRKKSVILDAVRKIE